ncbi:hypothetical protein TYRP_016906 [Tyrophagus putrescentiae]|nr:hypothetical protein TYRP_016906 [Tyrophagus putrescentiae]
MFEGSAKRADFQEEQEGESSDDKFLNGLISVSRLADQGFSVIFDQQKAVVTRQKFEVPTSNIELTFPRVGDLS